MQLPIRMSQECQEEKSARHSGNANGGAFSAASVRSMLEG